jgi:hypothetical protein
VSIESITENMENLARHLCNTPRKRKQVHYDKWPAPG